VREFLDDRKKLIIGMAVVIVVIAGYYLFGRDRVNEATSAEGERLAQEVTAPAAQAQDENAKSLLRNAAIAMESLFAERQTFEGALAQVPSIEPNIQWTPGNAAQASQNQVAVQLAPTNLGYLLSTSAPSGTTFTYSRDDRVQVVRSCGPGCTW
jgi:hypothetical protein